ncbi:MAG: hypothetical protein ACREMP_02985 [Candidatus Tyrphobacter sp.]
MTLRSILTPLLVAVLAATLSSCESIGTAFNPPRGASTSLKHMYLTQETSSGTLLVYSVPVTSSSTATATLSEDYPEELFVDGKGRIFVPLTGGADEGTVAVYNSPVTASSSPAFVLTDCATGGLCGSAGSIYPEKVAEDSSGNVYVSFPYTSSCCLNVFDGPVTASMSAPSVVLTNNGVTTGLSYPMGIGIDASNNLFVSSDASILQYSTPLTSSSNPSANVRPSGFPAGYNFGVAVDSQNRIFVADGSGCGSVAVFAEPLSGTSAFSIGVYPGSGCGTGHSVSSLAFDGSGNLWATVYGQGEVWEVTAPITSSSTAVKVLSGVTGVWGIAFGP